jgi:hypothetical protein
MDIYNACKTKQLTLLLDPSQRIHEAKPLFSLAQELQRENLFDLVRREFLFQQGFV